MRFLAHRIARSMINCWHDNAVCLWRCASIQLTAKVSEKVYRKCPLGTRFYNFQPPTPTLSSQTSHPQNFQISSTTTSGYIISYHIISVHHIISYFKRQNSLSWNRQA